MWELARCGFWASVSSALGVWEHADCDCVACAVSAGTQLLVEIEQPLLELIWCLLQIQRLDVQFRILLLCICCLLKLIPWLRWRNLGILLFVLCWRLCFDAIVWIFTLLIHDHTTWWCLSASNCCILLILLLSDLFLIQIGISSLPTSLPAAILSAVCPHISWSGTIYRTSVWHDQILVHDVVSVIFIGSIEMILFGDSICIQIRWILNIILQHQVWREATARLAILFLLSSTLWIQSEIQSERVQGVCLSAYRSKNLSHGFISWYLLKLSQLFQLERQLPAARRVDAILIGYLNDLVMEILLQLIQLHFPLVLYLIPQFYILLQLDQFLSELLFVNDIIDILGLLNLFDLDHIGLRNLLCLPIFLEFIDEVLAYLHLFYLLTSQCHLSFRLFLDLWCWVHSCICISGVVSHCCFVWIVIEPWAVWTIIATWLVQSWIQVAFDCLWWLGAKVFMDLLGQGDVVLGSICESYWIALWKMWLRGRMHRVQRVLEHIW